MIYFLFQNNSENSKKLKKIKNLRKIKKLIMIDTQTILGLLIIEKSGRRVLAQYNPNTDLKAETAQKNFEKDTINFLNNSPTIIKDTLSLINLKKKCLFIKNYEDFYIILISKENENKIFLKNVIEKVIECIEFFCGKNLDLGLIFQYYTEILLLFDEILNEGIVITLNTDEIVAKVLMQEHWKGQKRSGLFF